MQKARQREIQLSLIDRDQDLSRHTDGTSLTVFGFIDSMLYDDRPYCLKIRKFDEMISGNVPTRSMDHAVITVETRENDEADELRPRHRWFWLIFSSENVSSARFRREKHWWFVLKLWILSKPKYIVENIVISTLRAFQRRHRHRWRIKQNSQWTAGRGMKIYQMTSSNYFVE